MCVVCVRETRHAQFTVNYNLIPILFFAFMVYILWRTLHNALIHTATFFFLIQTYLFKDKGIVYFSYGANQEIFNCF